MAQSDRPGCLRCRHYYVTYDSSRPHGCRHFGFVSRRIPSLEVQSASGQFCQAFEERPAPPRRPDRARPTGDAPGAGPSR